MTAASAAPADEAQIDTSSEAVDRLAKVFDGDPGGPTSFATRVGSTLRTLAAERDAAVSALAGWQQVYDRASGLHAHTVRDLRAAEAERDALRAVALAVNEQMDDGEMPVTARVEDAMSELLDVAPHLLGGGPDGAEVVT